MLHIAIISGSVRTGRKSHNVAQYFNNYIKANKLATSEILDLKEYNFPVMEERLSWLKNPSKEARVFAERVHNADAIIVVSPEYNSSYPASLKNAIDLLYKEWHRKPIGIVGVSVGSFGGVNVIAQLQALFIKIKASPAASFPTPDVEGNFDDKGNALHPEKLDKRAGHFMDDLLWVAEAYNKMNFHLKDKPSLS